MTADRAAIRAESALSDVLLSVLREHERHWDTYRGQVCDCTLTFDTIELHRAHVASVLADAIMDALPPSARKEVIAWTRGLESGEGVTP